ncbi:MAG TPA: tetratricopeptide repeat protein [Planctomycetes bacterium]|nr:tetratricopeptide repeat protein [Planctomycetota bacterium]
MLRKITIAAITVVMAVCAGCESQAQSKRAARQRWDKTTARVKLALAQQQYTSGNYERAVKAVQDCLNTDPNNAAARRLYGKLLLGNGRRDEAIGQLSLSLELDEKLHESWYWLGVAAEESRDYEKAHEHYNTALSLEPTNVDYILAVADVQIARNNYSQAVELLTRKMSALPRDVSLKVALAELMLRIGKNERAIELYKQAMLMTGDDSNIAESLGFCLIFSGKWDEAAEIFDRLFEQCEDEHKKKLYLQVTALCSMNSAQYGRAVNCYNQLSIDDRDNAEIWVKMGQAILGTGAANRALMCGRKALTLQPGCSDAIVLIGCAQYAGGDYKAALASFEKIAADRENAHLSLLMRARCYEQLGQSGKAERAYKRAREINPHSELGDFIAKAKSVRAR